MHMRSIQTGTKSIPGTDKLEQEAYHMHTKRESNKEKTCREEQDDSSMKRWKEKAYEKYTHRKWKHTRKIQSLQLDCFEPLAGIANSYPWCFAGNWSPKAFVHHPLGPKCCQIPLWRENSCLATFCWFCSCKGFSWGSKFWISDFLSRTLWARRTVLLKGIFYGKVVNAWALDVPDLFRSLQRKGIQWISAV